MSRPQFHSTARRHEARRVIAQTSHTLTLHSTAHLPTVPQADADYWHDLRRGRRRIYGGLLHFIDRACAIGTPLEYVLLAIDTVRAYALDIYAATDRETQDRAA